MKVVFRRVEWEGYLFAWSRGHKRISKCIASMITKCLLVWVNTCMDACISTKSMSGSICTPYRPTSLHIVKTIIRLSMKYNVLLLTFPTEWKRTRQSPINLIISVDVIIGFLCRMKCTKALHHLILSWMQIVFYSWCNKNNQSKFVRHILAFLQFYFSLL